MNCDSVKLVQSNESKTVNDGDILFWSWIPPTYYSRHGGEILNAVQQ